MAAYATERYTRTAIALHWLIALVIFGPKRLPDLGRSLGSGMREFKDSITGNSKDDDDEPSKITAARAEETDAAVGCRQHS
mgnify:CR=1 FL=1